MEREEMVTILEEVARESGSGSARVAAVRALRQMAQEDEDPQARTFEAFEQLARARGQ